MSLSAVTHWDFFQNELKGFVYKRVKDKALTDDILHDVFLKVKAKMDQLQESEKITGWIYQITKNTIIDHFRKQSKTINVADLDWESEVPNFNECVSRYIKELIPTLPEKYRQAIQLTEIENLSQLELAARLGISYAGAKSRVQRARKILKDKLHEALILKTDAYGNIMVCVDRGHGCDSSN
jgi:RNA polymerase sigma-70 factor (ECF subfamily)